MDNIKDSDKINEVEGVEVIDVGSPRELPDDLKKTLDDLKAKYCNDTPSESTDVIDVTPEVVENTETKRYLSRTLYNKGVIEIPNGTVYYRKWKVKDKTAMEASKNISDLKYALVLNCIENDHNYALDNEEINFLLHNIRNESVHKPLKHTFICPDCGHTFNKEINIEDIVKTEGGNYNEEGNVIVGDYNIQFGNPINQDLYNEFMSIIDSSNYQLFVIDMVLHIRKFNDMVVNTRDDVIKVASEVDEIDADIADEIISKWNSIRYKVVIDNEIECPECFSACKLNFEDLPGFYPSSWNDWNI